MDNPLVSLKNISKTYGKTQILNGIDLDLRPKESIAILGPSGSGKTTLLYIMGCLDTQSSGDLYINGEPVTKDQLQSYRQNAFGLIFQSFYLLAQESLIENVLLPARIKGVATHKNSSTYKRACMLIDQVGLSSHLTHDVQTLSGGEKQRVACARALINDPFCILADEPTGSLDEENKKEIQKLLFDLTTHHGKSLVIVTHDQTLAQFANHKYILSNKKIEKI